MLRSLVPLFMRGDVQGWGGGAGAGLGTRGCDMAKMPYHSGVTITNRTSKIEPFAKIVNRFKLLFIFTKKLHLRFLIGSSYTNATYLWK